MNTFKDFLMRKLDEEFDDIFCPEEEKEQKRQSKLVMLPKQRLSLWIGDTTESVFCMDGINIYFQDPYILGSLKDSLKFVFSALNELK